MPISIAQTSLQAFRVIDQLVNNLSGLQRDIYSNAVAHRSLAQAEGADFAKIRSFVVDCLFEYRRRAEWGTLLVSDAERWPLIVAALPLYGLSESDVTAPLDSIVALNEALSALPLGSLSDVVALCDLITASVAPPLSLWPE